MYKKQRQGILQNLQERRANLSILDQALETHYIVPADNLGLIEKAVGRGCSQALELLARYDISASELADVLGVDVVLVVSIVESNPHADLILIDGEDATSLREESILASRKNIVSTFQARTNYASRIYFRPSGLELPYCIDDIVGSLTATGLDGQGHFPIDGMVYPKAESPEEMAFVGQILSDAEKKIGLEENSVKLQFLIESSQAVERLYEIAGAVKDRLSGIIFGMADYAADVGVEALDEDHPLFQYARMRIVNVAAALGVPSVDCMSFRYPVADKKLDIPGNKKLILGKMREVYDITLNSIRLGMKGKWVGHPLQLLAAKVAYETYFSRQRLEEHLEKLELYSGSTAGASIIHNDMADRATDRNVRSFLRRAVLKKKLEPERALQLGLIDQAELDLLNLRGRRDSNPRLPA